MEHRGEGLSVPAIVVSKETVSSEFQYPAS